MKLKETLKIELLGHPITVKVTNKVEELLLDNQLCCGICNPKESKIIIRNGMSEVEQTVTFYHEILHYIDYLMHNESFKYDEETVNVLARGLATLKIIKK